MLATAGSQGQAALGFLYLIILVVAYFVPLLVAWLRHVPNWGSVAVVNVLLGWTIVGWIIALAMACRSKPPPRAEWPPPYQQPRARGR